MESIKEAIIKAQASADRQRQSIPHRGVGSAGLRPQSEWMLPQPQLDPKFLEQSRIVSFARTDPSFIAFNMLRTNIYKILKDNGWKGLAITSPTARCGKTTVAVNLAFSLARQPDCRTVLVDLDLRKPAVAQMLGVEADKSIGEHLEGHAALAQCFVKISDNLFFGLSSHSIRDSAEILQDGRVSTMIYELQKALTPDIVIFDLPPMRAGDDAIGFMPNVESSLLVAAAGLTTAVDIDACAREITARANFVGVVLNKCTDVPHQYYY